MTKEKAHRQAEAVAMGITFYVVQRPEGDFLPVQEPPDDAKSLRRSRLLPAFMKARNLTAGK